MKFQLREGLQWHLWGQPFILDNILSTSKSADPSLEGNNFYIFFLNFINNKGNKWKYWI